MLDKTFAELVRAVDSRIRELGRATASQVERKDAADSVTWRKGDAWATLTLHQGGRLELTLHTRDDAHAETLEIRIDDPDVVNMIGEPVAALLAGKQQ